MASPWARSAGVMAGPHVLLPFWPDAPFLALLVLSRNTFHAVPLHHGQ